MSETPRSELGSKFSGQMAFIVDDEPQVRALLSRMLVSAGFTTREFSRIAELEAALTVARPSVIVLDLSLGETDAVEVMRSVAASRFGGKILLMSGQHDPKILDEVHKIGARHGLAMLPFLRKPFRLEELKAILAHPVEPAHIPAEGVDLEIALQNNWLELWYQPKIDLKSRLVCGAEGLVRLRHPERGIVPPSAFLPPPGDALYRPTD